jgi:hypothetical protein
MSFPPAQKAFRRWTRAEIDAVYAELKCDPEHPTRAAVERMGVEWPTTRGWELRLLGGGDPNKQPDDAFFVKLPNGEYGLKVTCKSRQIVAGMVLKARREDGSTSVVAVKDVLKQGTHYALCSIE